MASRIRLRSASPASLVPPPKRMASGSSNEEMAATDALRYATTGLVARARLRFDAARSSASAALSFSPVARLTIFLIARFPRTSETLVVCLPRASQGKVISPTSPAAKCTPRWIAPFKNTPAPTPVPRARKTKSFRSLAAPSHFSPRAPQFASPSTNTGIP